MGTGTTKKKQYPISFKTIIKDYERDINDLEERKKRIESAIIAKEKIIIANKKMPENCLKCRHLEELFERTPKSDRDYWLMTELFVLLHGSDVCKLTKRDIKGGSHG